MVLSGLAVASVAKTSSSPASDLRETPGSFLVSLAGTLVEISERLVDVEADCRAGSEARFWFKSVPTLSEERLIGDIALALSMKVLLGVCSWVVELFEMSESASGKKKGPPLEVWNLVMNRNISSRP